MPPFTKKYSSVPVRSMLPALVLLLSSCGSGPSFTTLPDVAANPNPKVSQAAVLKFAADQPVHTTIQVSDGTNQWELNYDDTKDPAEGLPVIGMRPERRHEIRVSIRGAEGKETAAPETLEFTTPPLPADRERFPPIEVTVHRPEEVEPGFILFNPRRRRPGAGRFGAGFGMLLVVDHAGEVLWYYRMDSRISDFELLRNGNLIYVTQDYRLIEIDWLGNTINEWYASGRPQGPAEGATPVETLTFHHEIDELPNGNLVVLGSERKEIDNYYSSETSAKAPRKRQNVMGDVIIEFERDTGKIVWEWKAFDHMDPFRIGYETFRNYWVRRGFPDTLDWSHANNLLYDAADDSLIVNFRYQAAAIKIDRKTKRIKWIFGEPSGWGKLEDRLLKPAGKIQWPYHQHSPTPTPQGTLLVFDNGNYQARPFTPAKPPRETYTRAVEYKIDEENMTVEEIWASEGPGPDSVVTFAMGDVEWLPKTRNVLAAYGFTMMREDVESGKFDWANAIALHSWTRLREYKRSDPPKVVWEIVLLDKAEENPVGWSLFGAEHLPSWGR